MSHCLIICSATSSSAHISFFSLALAQLARIPWNGDDPFLTVNVEGKNPVLDYLKEFTLVFSKTSFDVLPDSRKWDHAAELIPRSKPSGCKVYPLSLTEQKELDAFLKENLETSWIWPSKSPMSSPVFFIKKKDGSLRLVQDYRAFVRGHLRAPTSLMEYVCLTTPDKLHLADTLYIPPHCRWPHHSSPTISPSQPPLTNQAQSWT